MGAEQEPPRSTGSATRTKTLCVPDGSDDAGGGTQAAGELKVNPYGLFDIHGNVWEWVEDGGSRRTTENSKKGPPSIQTPHLSPVPSVWPGVAVGPTTCRTAEPPVATPKSRPLVAATLVFGVIARRCRADIAEAHRAGDSEDAGHGTRRHRPCL